MTPIAAGTTTVHNVAKEQEVEQDASMPYTVG
jgi:hypothetical protein